MDLLYRYYGILQNCWQCGYSGKVQQFSKYEYGATGCVSRPSLDQVHINSFTSQCWSGLKKLCR